MEIAKALVLAGRTDGERPWPVAPGGVKHLMPVANRPILFHHLEVLRSAGLLEATIAVDPAEAHVIQDAVDACGDWQLRIRWSGCQPGVGLIDLLETSREFIADEPVLVQDGGSPLRDRTHARIRDFAREGLDAVALRLTPADRCEQAKTTLAYLLSARAVNMLLAHPDPRRDPLAIVGDLGGRVRVEQVDGC